MTHYLFPRLALKTLLIALLLLTGIGSFAQKNAAKTFKPDQYGMISLGARIEYGKPRFDTIEMEEPSTKEILQKIIRRDPMPEKVNGKDIVTDAKPAAFKGGDAQLYIFRQMKQQLSKLEDGFYTIDISNIIVDENGKTCGFMYSPVKGTKAANPKQGEPTIKVDPKTEKEIFDKACDIMQRFPTWKPAELKGKKVAGEGNGATYRCKIIVEKHKVSLQQSDDIIVL